MSITIKDMTELSQIIVNRHKVRFTAEQKQAFCGLIKKNIPNKPYYDELLGENKNIIISDIYSADVILTAHYDTPKRQLAFEPLIRPMGKGLINLIKRETLYFYIIMIISLLYIIYGLSISSFAIYLVSSMLFIICQVFLYFLYKYRYCFLRKPNKNNYNDNTSGVITIIEHIQTTAESEIKFAYIFFDNEEKGLKGSKALKKAVKQMNDKIIINFDCVGVGDEIHIILPKSKSLWDNVDLSTINVEDKSVHIVKQSDVYSSSDNKSFSNAICITAFERDKKGNMIMKNVHTEKDDYMDYANIKAVIKVLEIILQRIIQSSSHHVSPYHNGWNKHYNKTR